MLKKEKKVPFKSEISNQSPFSLVAHRFLNSARVISVGESVHKDSRGLSPYLDEKSIQVQRSGAIL